MLLKNQKKFEDQEEKQIDALKTLKPKELEPNKDNKSDNNKKLLKYKEIFDDLSNGRIGKILNMSKQIDFNNLTSYFKDKNIRSISFVGFRGLMHIHNDIYQGNTSIEKIEKEFKSNLGEITKGNVLILELTDKIDLRRGEKIIGLSNLSIYYTWKNIKCSHKNTKFKMSPPIRNDEYKSPDGSQSKSNIQYNFEYILKKHEENIDNPSISIYVKKIENRLIFKIKTGYILSF